MTRIPREAADLLMTQAHQAGVSYSEYIAYLVAVGVGLDAPEPCPHDPRQEGLPLTG